MPLDAESLSLELSLPKGVILIILLAPRIQHEDVESNEPENYLSTSLVPFPISICNFLLGRLARGFARTS